MYVYALWYFSGKSIRSLLKTTENVCCNHFSSSQCLVNDLLFKSALICSNHFWLCNWIFRLVIPFGWLHSHLRYLYDVYFRVDFMESIALYISLIEGFSDDRALDVMLFLSRFCIFHQRVTGDYSTWDGFIDERCLIRALLHSHSHVCWTFLFLIVSDSTFFADQLGR